MSRRIRRAPVPGQQTRPDASRTVGSFWLPLAVLGAVLPLLIAWPARAAQPGIARAKIDSHLIDLLDASARGAHLKTYAAERGLTVKAGKRVLADVYFTGPRERAETLLRNRGTEIIATSENTRFKIIEGWVALRAIFRIARSPSVKSIVAVVGGGVDPAGGQPTG
jgi:hypothetical protein